MRADWRSGSKGAEVSPELAGKGPAWQIRRGGTGVAASVWSLGPSLSQCRRPNAAGDEQKQASPRRKLLPQKSLYP